MLSSEDKLEVLKKMGLMPKDTEQASDYQHQTNSKENK